MQVADFISAAGCDPYQKADDVLGARPVEVAALGEAFAAAAAALQSSGGLSTLAGQLADASAVFDGASPTDLMLEVTAIQQTLDASPQVLHTIGAQLGALAGESAQAQQQVSAALADLEEKAVPILQSYAQPVDVLVVGATAWWNEHISAGAALVQTIHAAVSATVDAYDARLGEVLLGLQAVGYLMPPDVDAGVSAPPAAGTSWVAEADIGPYQPGGNPAHTAQWWATLSATEQATMMQHYPQLIALLHGLPSHVYHAVNLREVANDSADLQPALAEVSEVVWASPELTPQIKETIGISSPEDIAALSSEQMDALEGWMLPSSYGTMQQLKTLRSQQESIIDLQKSIATGDDGKNRYLLEYDLDAFDGDGTAVIGIGEINTADNVAVVVQGATHDLGSIAAQTSDAEAVLSEMDTLSEADNAVIVYEGYDNPSLPTAIFYPRASAGGHYLVDDLHGYAAAHEQATGGADTHTTVIGHSYGTVTTRFALEYGATSLIDDVVLYGSPGVGLGHVSQLGMDPSNVYVGMDPDDELNYVELLGAVMSDVLLGPDPATTEFGATVLGTDGVDGHGDYFGYQSGQPNEALTNAAAVAVDQPEHVVITHAPPPTPAPELCVPQ